MDLVISEFKASAEHKGLKLKGSCPAEFENKTRLIDRTRLLQILRNLISNAIKFTDTGGISIEARTGQSPDLVIFTVSDTGCGIPENKLRVIFEAFEQSDQSRKEELSGTGLGLAISKKLAGLMGGAIDVSSSVGQGSSFELTVSLPESNLEAVTSNSDIDITKLNPARILVADDVMTNLIIFSALLKDCPYTIDQVENGELAVERSLDKDYDVVFLDIQMPVMDGVSALAALRAANYNQPIIACTANVMKEDVDSYLAAGFDSVIGKPYLKEDLVSHIQAAVTRKNL